MRIELILRYNAKNGSRDGRRIRFSDVFGSQFDGIIGEYRRQVRASQTSLRPVHGIGPNRYFSDFTIYHIFFKTIGYLENNIGITRLDTLHRLLVCIGDIGQNEIARRDNFPYQTFRIGAMIIIDNTQFHVLDLLIGRPRKDQHYHQRHHDYQPREERISDNLLKLLFYQVLQHGYLNLNGF